MTDKLRVMTDEEIRSVSIPPSYDREMMIARTIAQAQLAVDQKIMEDKIEWLDDAWHHCGKAKVEEYQQAHLNQMDVQYDKLEALWHSKMEEAVRAEREKIEAIVDNNYREGVVALWDALKTYLKAVKE